MTDDPLAKVESFTLVQLHEMWAHETGPLADAKFLPESAVREAMSRTIRKLLHYDPEKDLVYVDFIEIQKLADRLGNKK